MALEFLHGGTITPKSDIFSLGVIIMEVVTGHRDYLVVVTKASLDDFIELVREFYLIFQNGGLCFTYPMLHFTFCTLTFQICVLILQTLTKWRNVLHRSLGHRSLETDLEQIKRCMHVGLICVNPDRTKRPQITEVISMLEEVESTFSIPR